MGNLEGSGKPSNPLKRGNETVAFPLATSVHSTPDREWSLGLFHAAWGGNPARASSARNSCTAKDRPAPRTVGMGTPHERSLEIDGAPEFTAVGAARPIRPSLPSFT